MLFLCGCGGDDAQRSYQHIDSGAIAVDQPRPLSQAFELLGLQPRDLLRFKHLQANYLLTGRTPIIDQISSSPYSLFGWADGITEQMQKAFPSGLSFPLHQMALTLDPYYQYKTQTAARQTDTLEAAYLYLLGLHGTRAEPEVIDAIRTAGLTAEFDRQCGRLLHALADAEAQAQAAYAKLSEKEQLFLLERPERYFFPDGQQFNFLTAATHQQLRILNICRKIDFNRLFTAALMTADALDTFIKNTRQLTPLSVESPMVGDAGQLKRPVLDLPSPIGPIRISGTQSDRIEGRYALLIDLGGNDRYAGSAVNGFQERGRISLHVDLEGNDVYDDGRKPHAQGFGCLGIGMLVDAGGDDRYIAGNMAQGAGIYGIGMLADLAGNDSYKMGLIGQGFGLLGTGLLLDFGGNDSYLANGMAQGVGSTHGIGYLGDARGRDRYVVDRGRTRGSLIPDVWSHAQGAGLSIRLPDWKRRFSIYGGIGLLSEGAGNDIYYASDGNCMGSSYFMSVGALVDHGGNDQYLPQNGYGMGFAVHLSNAILIDRAGNDVYFSKKLGGGVASDRSLAMLVDLKGNDVYGPSQGFIEQAAINRKQQNQAGGAIPLTLDIGLADTSYGAALKPGALGMIIDVSGADRYFYKNDGRHRSGGGVLPPDEPYEWSYALQIDLNGEDYYYDQRQNNAYTIKFGHALGYDVNLSPSPDFRKMIAAHIENQESVVPRSSSAKKAVAQFEAILSRSGYDGFNRFSAVGALALDGPTAARVLLDLLQVSPASHLNRDLIEALNHILINPAHRTELEAELINLIDAGDPYVQVYASRVIGNFGIHNGLDELLQKSSSEPMAVRHNMLWAIGQLDSDRALEYLLETLHREDSNSIRITAVRALESFLQRNPMPGVQEAEAIKSTLRQCLADQDASVRTVAARNMQVFGSESSVQAVLKPLLEDQNVYVRRAAAKSLILNGDKDGIPILIDSLQYPSIDTQENYDREIVKDLSFYCGIAFSGAERYRYDNWLGWWQENGDRVDLKHNLDIMRQIHAAFRETISEEKGVAIFRRLRAEYPNNPVVKTRFERFCYEWITYRLLTRKELTPDVWDRIVRLQQFRVALAPQDAGKLGMLAYYKAKQGRYDAAVNDLTVALKMDPQNTDFLKALKQYQALSRRSRQ